MKGRVRTKQTQCNCGQKFVEIPGTGYLCLACRCVPTRFFVDFFWSGQRIKLYSDQRGLPLDTYLRAKNQLAVVQNEIANHIFDPSRYIKSDIKQYLFETVAQKWFEGKERDVEKGKMSPGGLHPIKSRFANYIIPYFTGRDIRDIRTMHLKEFYRQLPDRLSSRTHKHILEDVRNFLNDCYRDEIISKLPLIPEVTVEEPPIKWCRRDVQDKILAAIPDQDRAIFFFLTRQGVRPSEGCLVQWGDIDFENQVLNINRTYSRDQIMERPKSKKSRPRLIHPEIIAMLNNVPKGFPKSYIFFNPRTQKPYRLRTIDIIWKQATEKTNIDITLYQATRHSVASMAASAGISLKIIQKFLGHTSMNSTNRYADLDVSAQQIMFSTDCPQPVRSVPCNKKR